MSQAKTQMPNKSFGLNNNTSVQSADDSNWSDGLGHFRSSNSTNTGDPSMNWSSSGTNINAVKLIASNSGDLWSSENHNNFNQNLDDLLKTDKVIKNINCSNIASGFFQEFEHSKTNIFLNRTIRYLPIATTTNQLTILNSSSHKTQP